MEKIAVFSDIHGNLQALQAILKDIKNEKIDNIICLGDVIGIGPNSKETLGLIRENKIELILGNHELYFLNQFKDNEILEEGKRHQKHHEWISSLLNQDDREFLSKCKLNKEIPSNNIILSHFLLKENIQNGRYPFLGIDIRKEENRKLIKSKYEKSYNLFGHIHEPCYFEIGANNYYCLGSSGCRHDNKTFYNILQIEDNKITINRKELIFDRTEFEKNIKLIDYPEKDEIYNRFFNKIKK